MPTKSANNALELGFINYIPANNTLNFTATPITGGAAIVDATAGVYANGAFAQANAAFNSANNVAPQVQPAFDRANAAFAAANNVAPQIQPAFDKANAAFNAANISSAYGANTNSTNFFALPVGTTAQRPASPANGSIRLNTTSRKIEVYIDNYWANITSAVYVVDYLVVAGGGGASGGVSGVNYGAGGAGGTVRVGKLEVSPGVSYTISVGAGGTGAGSNGSSSNIRQTAGQLIVVTAGGGEGPGASSFVGGRNDDYTGGGAQPGFAAVGGGAGGGGGTTTGNGGPAYTWPFNGTAYAGGGGGGQGASHGGGGYAPNSGGGAQGQGSTIPNTAGGSGIIIITYPGPTQRALGGTVTTSNGYYFHTFTGSGTFTA